jgi:predicted DNA-binding antitoxin AbrB/MazE fold protein
MGRIIRARWSRGRLEPLENLELPDGKEVTVTITEVSPSRNLESFRRAAGGWKGQVNAPALIRRIYANRLISTRLRPRV